MDPLTYLVVPCFRRIEYLIQPSENMNNNELNDFFMMGDKEIKRRRGLQLTLEK